LVTSLTHVAASEEVARCRTLNRWAPPAMIRAQCRRLAVALSATLPGCTVNRPIELSPGPTGVAEYLATHQPSDLLVTDRGGHSKWFHNPRLDGDTLRGLRSRDLPRQVLAIPIGEINGLATAQFSTGRTVGLVAALVGVLTVTVLIAASHGPEPL
jgi:hypothetical protein